VVDLDSRQLATHHQITAPQLLTLMAVVEQQSTTSIALARRVHLDASTLVRVIDRLEAKGLIRRARDSHDRRHVRLSVTRSGRALVARTPFPLQYSLEKALRQMPEAERARLAGCLETLVRRISAPAPQDVPPPPLLEILGRARATTAGF
jgi:DNA-binding MarR family transcriptional regulator